MARRMYQYSYRIEDRYLVDGADSGQHLKDGRGTELTGLCILTAGAKGPAVLSYTRGFGNYGVKFTCPVLYLAQWLDRLDELAASARTNPFAVIVMAQLLAQQTHGQGTKRLASKTQVRSEE